MIKYEEAVVTFFDILGFKCIVDSKPPEEIANILAYFGQVGDSVLGRVVNYRFDYVAFSDMGLHIIDLEKIEGECGEIDKLIAEIFNISLVQYNLYFFNNLFVRGAMTLGAVNLYNVGYGQSVFGPAFNRAHCMERKIALYPRVIIDSEVLIRYADFLDSIPEEDSWIDYSLSSLLKQDSDGLWFVDYLGIWLRHEMDLNQRLKDVVKHRELIIEKAPKENKLDRLTTKYLWLGRYHNSVVEECYEKYLRNETILKDELKIKAEDVKNLFDL